jgi:flagellar FliJ protein
MRHRDRLKTLQQLAAHAEAEAARHLGERQRALAAEEQRLRQIHGYLQDYERRTGTTGILTSVTALTSGRRFLDRLRDAVGQQQGVVENHRRLVEQQSGQWRAARAKRQALEKLGERRLEAETARREAREQRRLDEVGGRQVRG